MPRLSIVIAENKQRQERALSGSGSLLIRRADPDSRTDGASDNEPLERSPTSMVYVTSPHVSQKHAVIRQGEDGRVFVKDMNSLNGTFLRLPPFQEFELPGDFELLLGQDVVVQRQNSLWEASPDVCRFASVEDFLGYLRHQLKHYVTDITLSNSPSSSAGSESTRQPLKCSRMPLLERQAYLLVSWKQSTFNLAMERWLQMTVSLFNSGASRGNETPWEFLGTSPERHAVLSLARKVAANDGTVLLCGRSGAGKDVLARDIHRHSSRAKGPFVSINCATLPKDLVEGELFGTKSGGFSGAIDRPGLFEQANNGTIFLDEIGELPADLQPKLLRVLDNKCVRRVGDVRERPVNVRIITATNRNLEKMVAERTFRDDLRFRLEAVRLILPDLRSSDVRALVGPLLSELEEKGYGTVTADEAARLTACAERSRWPGNARHLKNVLGRYLTFREQPRSVEANWEFSLKMDDTAYDDGPALGVLPVMPSQAVEEAAPSSETPEGAMAVIGHLDNLIFLTIAREVFASTGRGALAELGRRTNMTGAGAASRLKKLKIPTEPVLDVALLESHIDELRSAMQPFSGYLRGLLSL